MNAQRIAALFRALAERDRERADLEVAIAEALEDVGAAPSRPTVKKGKGAALLAPAETPSAEVLARGRLALRKAGLR